MKEYHKLIKHILKNGVHKSNRTNVNALSVFGYQMRYDLNDGLPIVTTKKIHTKSIIHELLWMLKGDTNIKYLLENGVSIWSDWPYDKYKKSAYYNGETLKEFEQKIVSNKEFAKTWGDLGPVYGKQWRNFCSTEKCVDQVQMLINSLKTNPHSRRHIINSWHSAEIDKMALAPCHCLVQFYVVNNKLSCQLYQRSADVFLGVPFNITFYAIFSILLAKTYGFDYGEFIHTFGDVHIYENHIEQVKLQLSRTPLPLPDLKIIKQKSIFDYEYEHFDLINYQHYPAIRGEVAV